MDESKNASPLLVQLRLLIARAAQKDSLRWWDDESLTPNGDYLLDRVFPNAPSVIGQNLAIAAASARHDAALSEINAPIHLFHLDSQARDGLMMRKLRLSKHNEVGPISDMNALRQRLLDLAGKAPKYEIIGRLNQNNALRIRIADDTGDMTRRAQALAWAYLEGQVGQPVFPYIAEPS